MFNVPFFLKTQCPIISSHLYRGFICIMLLCIKVLDIVIAVFNCTKEKDI